MVTRLLSIGSDKSLDFEESIKIKLLNVVSFLFVLISYIFIIKHLFFTHKYEVALTHFLSSLTIYFIFFLQHKQKHLAARVVFFTLLHIVIFISSMFLLMGKGVENFYIVNIILILILISERVWVYILLVFNAFLFVSPQLFYHPYPIDNYSFVTYLVLFFSVIIALRFFLLIQNQFKGRLKIQNDHLERLNEEKNDLMSIVAHDLKNPLTQINGLVSILELSNNQLNQEQKELIEKIKGVTNNQRQQITGFLNAKSFEDSFEEITFEKVRVRWILETVLDEMLAQAIAKGIRLTYVKNAKRNLTISGRKDWLFKVISNLVSNAIKFSNSGTEISIEVKSTEKQIVILVKDQGQGFNSEDLKEVFKKNTILSATPTANEHSSGVGLYIVKKYVNQMHGTVTLESVEGKGSTFFITLPR